MSQDLLADLVDEVRPLLDACVDALPPVDALRVHRRRLRRALQLAGALMLFVACVAIAVAVARDDAPGPDHSNAGVPPPGFAPPTNDVGGGEVETRIVLPDGQHVTLRYPEQLDFARGGMEAATAIDWPARAPSSIEMNGCCSRPLSVREGRVEAEFGAHPLSVTHSTNGVTLYRYRAHEGSEPLDTLAFQVGKWVVSTYDYAEDGPHAADGMTEADRKVFAESLTGTIDPDGFLQLHARPPLRLVAPAGPVVALGPERANVTLLERDCAEPTTKRAPTGYRIESELHGLWLCVAPNWVVHANGTDEFLTSIRDHLTFRVTG